MAFSELRQRLRLPTFAEASPWLCLALMWLVFQLPETLRTTGFEIRELRGSGDLLALLTLVAVSYRFHWARFVRVLAAVFAGLLMVFKLDRAIFGFIINEDPVLYDQVFMLRHLYVLLGDLWSREIATMVVSFVLSLAVLVWLSVVLVRRSAPLLSPEREQQTWQVVFASWLIALLGSATPALGLTKKPLVRFDSPALTDNVERSLGTYRTVTKGLSKSPYTTYDALKLTRTPNVLIYVVESYGRRIWDRTDMRGKHTELLKKLGERLQQAGIESASAFSASSVRGARSWLANATLLLGAPVRFEAVFQSLSPNIAKRPNMVSFFKQRGYETVFVSPADRPRAGLVSENTYAYDRIVDFHTLDYRGPSMGWGLVPDQYSMGVVEQTVLRGEHKPLFMNFHLVASHAPWRDVPIKVDDYRELSKGSEVQTPEADASTEWAFKRLNHFTRDNHTLIVRPLSERVLAGYLATLAYDLDLITEQATRLLDENTLMILIGDHQPPLIGVHEGSPDSPVHILARDPKLLAEFKRRGFKKGLTLDRYAQAPLGHAGMFSLIARTLAHCCSDGTYIPPFLREGYELTK